MFEELEERMACVHGFNCGHCQACQYGRHMGGSMVCIQQNIGDDIDYYEHEQNGDKARQSGVDGGSPVKTFADSN